MRSGPILIRQVLTLDKLSKRAPLADGVTARLRPAFAEKPILIRQVLTLDKLSRRAPLADEVVAAVHAQETLCRIGSAAGLLAVRPSCRVVRGAHSHGTADIDIKLSWSLPAAAASRRRGPRPARQSLGDGGPPRRLQPPGPAGRHISRSGDPTGSCVNSRQALAGGDPTGSCVNSRQAQQARAPGRRSSCPPTPRLRRGTAAVHAQETYCRIVVMLENRTDVRYVQAMLGHASLPTAQVYTHVSIKALQEVHARTHPAARLSQPKKRRSRRP